MKLCRPASCLAEGHSATRQIMQWQCKCSTEHRHTQSDRSSCAQLNTDTHGVTAVQVVSWIQTNTEWPQCKCSAGHRHTRSDRSASAQLNTDTHGVTAVQVLSWTQIHTEWPQCKCSAGHRHTRSDSCASVQLNTDTHMEWPHSRPLSQSPGVRITEKLQLLVCYLSGTTSV